MQINRSRKIETILIFRDLLIGKATFKGLPLLHFCWSMDLLNNRFKAAVAFDYVWNYGYAQFAKAFGSYLNM